MELSALINLRYPEKAWSTVDAASKVIKNYNYELGVQEDVDPKPILDVSAVVVMCCRRVSTWYTRGSSVTGGSQGSEGWLKTELAVGRM